MWQEIFEGRAKWQTKYRYYFNLMYVGISRAQKYLCIINEHDVGLYEKYLEQNLGYVPKKIKNFDYKKLMLHTLDRSNLAWMEFAESAMKKGDYENAAIYFRRAGAGQEKIWKCQMFLLMDKYSYEEALRYAILLQDEKNAKKCYHNCIEEVGIVKLAKIWLEKKGFSRKNGYTAHTIGDLIKQEFVDFDAEVQEQIRFLYVELLTKKLKQQVEEIFLDKSK